MTEETIEFDVVEEDTSIKETAHKIFLASIGAIALAQDEIEELITKLIERGETAEQEGKELVNEVMDRRKKIQKKTENEINSQIEQILERMDVPTKADIDSLSKKITALSKKIDELNKEQSAK
jgi:poly(hydroxyalkanoate) granule-associated protein